jgi:hypothetical protein
MLPQHFQPFELKPHSFPFTIFQPLTLAIIHKKYRNNYH